MSETDRSPHPKFDDKGSLDWKTKWADALEEAKAGNKKIFIEAGREL